MELSIVILNWNAADDTIACVQRISAWRRLHPIIWVVDNASDDASVEAILRECPAVRLIQNPVNLGFAGGTNRGITKALEEIQAPIMLLNNDAFIDEDDVCRLLKTINNDGSIGMVGPLLFDAKQKDRLLSAGGKNPVLHHQTRLLEYDHTQTHQPVQAISGTAVIIRAELFNRVGLLDEAYFFSTELADLSTRASRQGFLCVIDVRARAYHAVGRSAHYRNNLYTYYIIRNRFLYIQKFYHSFKKGLLYSFWGGYGLALMVKLYLMGQQAVARAVGLGTIDGWRGRFGGQNERVLTDCAKATDSMRPVNSKQF